MIDNCTVERAKNLKDVLAHKIKTLCGEYTDTTGITVSVDVAPRTMIGNAICSYTVVVNVEDIL